LQGVGFVFEVCADQSKDIFASDPANRGKFLHSNVWALSRHPNYFGEITYAPLRLTLLHHFF
jgi:steroid 5-alpha reductase family enzyme